MLTRNVPRGLFVVPLLAASALLAHPFARAQMPSPPALEVRLIPPPLGFAASIPLRMTPDAQALLLSLDSATGNPQTTGPVGVWTATGGSRPLPVPADSWLSWPLAISDDGSTVSGLAATDDEGYMPMRWTGDEPPVTGASLPLSAGFLMFPLASADGGTFILNERIGSRNRARRWSADSGVHELTVPGADGVIATDISPDGRYACGTYTIPSEYAFVSPSVGGVIWDGNTPVWTTPVSMQTGSLRLSSGPSVSWHNEGNTFAEFVQAGPNMPTKTIRTLLNRISLTSDNGAVFFGEADYPVASLRRDLSRANSARRQSISRLFAAAGIDMSGSVVLITDANSDGTVFCGYLRYNSSRSSTGFLVTAPLPCSAADVACSSGAPVSDGRLDVNDLVVFMQGFFTVTIEPRNGEVFVGDAEIVDIAGRGGQMGPDGRCTADDLIAFFNLFFAGCP